ncbi:MAG: hypothetical protein AAFY38_07455 [Pseudomonadota bacterium]
MTPASEDAGLFRCAPRGLEVALVPQVARNRRGDILVRGFVQERYPVLVVFAGRRAQAAERVERRLSTVLHRARHAAGHNVDIDLLRVPIWVNGRWRRRFIRDVAGWEQGEHHLIAACWTLPAPPGPPLFFGEEPVHEGDP